MSCGMQEGDELKMFHHRGSSLLVDLNFIESLIESLSSNI